MLQQIAHIIIISFICIIWGLPAYIIIRKNAAEEYWYGKATNTLIFLFFSGLLSLAAISAWLVLLIPLQINFLLPATIILLFILLIFFKKHITLLYQQLKVKEHANIFQSVFCFSSILLFTLLGSLKPVNIDTQLYHLQIIKWTNEYGTVPGLANLYPRLGLGSSWFNLISLFHIPSFINQNFTFLNTTTTIWFLLWLMNRWRCHCNSKDNTPYSSAFSLFYFFLIAYFLYDWQLFRDTANSTSYDFIVTVLTIAVISFIAEGLFSEKKNNLSFVVIILALFIIPFKLSGILILIPIFFYLLNFNNRTLWVKLFFAGSVIILPLLIKNYIVTGYPLYPSTLSVGTPEWQLPEEMATKFKEYIFYVNKFYDHQISFIFSYEKTAFNWIPFWIGSILLKHKILFLLSGLSLILFFYNPLSQKKPLKIRVFIASLWLMVTGWFFTAPDPRFALGFILVLAFLPLSILAGKYIPLKKLSNTAFAITTLFILFYTLKKSKILIKQPEYLYRVINCDIPPYQNVSINNNPYNTPERINNNWDNRCFFIPLPCMCETNPFIKLRSGNIKKGFMMQPQPDSAFIQNYNY
jgi:hypothetical protein